jgi:hypothetical protein
MIIYQTAYSFRQIAYTPATISISNIGGNMNIPRLAFIKRPSLPKITRKRLIATLLVVVLIGAGVEGSLYYRHRQYQKTHFTYNGKEYKRADYISSNSSNVSQQQSLDDQIAQHLAVTNSPGAGYDDFLALAQLYVQKGDKQKAAENYDIAKTKLDPKNPNYSGIIKFLDEVIKTLKSGS